MESMVSCPLVVSPSSKSIDWTVGACSGICGVVRCGGGITKNLPGRVIVEFEDRVEGNGDICRRHHHFGQAGVGAGEGIHWDILGGCSGWFPAGARRQS